MEVRNPHFSTISEMERCRFGGSFCEFFEFELIIVIIERIIYIHKYFSNSKMSF